MPRRYHVPMPSLRNATPVAFVSTTDMERARAFYEATLGLTFVADEGFALVFDLDGTMLRVTRVDRLDAQPFTVLGWWVEDAAEAASSLSAAGIELQRYPGLEQDGLGIWTSPSGTRIAWFRDPDGNVLSVAQQAAG
jgi:catechol 2,3-dioxygenase-like lactoylglutathione lyase family enzyme